MKKLSILLLIIVGGCATTPQGTVIPREGGIYTATADDKNQDVAFKIALDTAANECKSQGKRHIILDQKNSGDKGLTSEKTADLADLAGKVAMLTGNGFFGASGDDLRGKKHCKLTFRCE